MSLDELRGLYPGETCWIVGKGPSLRYLQAKHFGAGPVIAVNDSIALVQELGLPNKIYSLQKDGNPEHMTEPHPDVALIVQKEYPSAAYFLEHPERYEIDPMADMGYPRPTILATRMAIALAVAMGCAALRMMCFDNLVTGTLETYHAKSGELKMTGAAQFYRSSRPLIQRDLEKIAHKFILPGEEPIDMQFENLRTLRGDNTIGEEL